MHRELASALSCPVGFKNGTDGNVKIAVDAIKASSVPHVLYSPDKKGQMCIYQTHGNPHAHVILRGGKTPNYQAEHVTAAQDALFDSGINKPLMIDCSHGNSNKDHTRQQLVADDLAQQIAQGSNAIFGVMIESFLVAGQQSVVNGKAEVYGQSITDACVDMNTSELMLETLAKAVQQRRKR